jgi:hypothetical protein
MGAPVMAQKDRTNCRCCGGVLFHDHACRLVAEERALEALEALTFAYAGCPLQRICPCELGYPGVLGCPHQPRQPMTS